LGEVQTAVSSPGVKRKKASGPVSSPEEDARLVRAVLGGDEESYAELVRRYMNVVVGFAYNRVRDFHRAEDLAQDTFLKAFGSLASLQDHGKFGSWLLVITRHTCMDWLRASKDSVSLDDLRESGHEPEAEDAVASLDRVGDEEIEQRILEAIHELREDYRDIIVMKHIDQKSYKEIGRLLGMSVSAVGEKLSRVRQILRKKLGRVIGEAEDE
jgi:RNA polymerase sigma-70 factor (ECF subfamily)